jgi:hypothetical protein
VLSLLCPYEQANGAMIWWIGGLVDEDDDD